jgi:hypothetical protein
LSLPRHKRRKVWYPTTQSAMGLLDKAHLGSPSHIIIHIGSSDAACSAGVGGDCTTGSD